jgi:nickel/cobalt transporter (NicO) family protein
MASLYDLLQTGAASVGLLLSSALVLGALHGLEPGHSKTMMTAFIVAVRGSVAQAALLGLAATVSHTAVVWVVALLGLHFASRYDAAFAEPYFQITSVVLILVIALWMLWRTWRQQRSVRGPAQQHRHDDGDHHSHQDAHQLAHADEIRHRFASANVTTGQIVMLGLSGGLIPCSAAIAVLALCLQINQLWLGIALVACFSIGLAATLVAAGMVAAVGMRHVSRRWSGWGDLARRAPYLSGIVMIGVGLYVGWEGWANSFTAL